MSNKGFTLLEMLVVVLIIGVLTAIVMPGYFYTIRASKIKSRFPIFRSIMDAQKRYYLSTGTRTADLDLLDVSMPYLTKSDPAATGRISYTATWGSFNLYTRDSDYIVFGVGDITIDYYGTPRGGSVGSCYALSEESRNVCAKLGRHITDNATGAVYSIENW